MQPAIETQNLTKRYGDVEAVTSLSIRVMRGEIYAFLGLNGAGKTTTIRMLLGMIKPAAGEIQVLGSRIERKHKKPWDSVGYLVETPHAYPELSVRQNLDVVRRLRPRTPLRAVDEIIEQLGLAAYADRRARTLSHGNAQRLGLAKALIHRPKLLILDEPANGLDPAGIIEIRDLLTELTQERGVTIFMSSHILGEVSRLADRIGIIHQGRLIQELSTEELQRKRHRRLLLRTRDPQAAQTSLNRHGFSALLRPDGTIEVDDEEAINHPDEIAQRLVRQGQALTMLKVNEEDLEDYFMRLVRKPDRQAG
ncbi:MAG: ATP-binding cassette domain-containing protein [Anaerolineales bacterium]